MSGAVWVAMGRVLSGVPVGAGGSLREGLAYDIRMRRSP